MKKLTVWALLAMFVVAGAAFAAPAKVAPNASDFGSGAPATTNNDESCDITVAPAATLLLPYFEVAEDPSGETTIFTITNTSEAEAIAHVVLWTDWSFPVIDFNIYLTGYDVQSINLNDVIWRGVIAPASGDKDFDGTSADGTNESPSGDESVLDGSLDYGTDCDDLVGDLPQVYQDRLQEAFTEGTDNFPGGCSTDIGGVHENAVGYVTIDVADFCGTGLPTAGDDYFLNEIRFDNVLIGDYQQVNSDNDFAQGNPMVHIKAVPEGTGDTVSDEPSDSFTNFDRTFYSRYQSRDAVDGPGTLDRRQPLPSLFAARWISGGDTDFDTSFKIWREGLWSSVDGTGEVIAPSCGSYEDNGQLLLTESVIFDEDENGSGFVGSEIIISPPIETDAVVLPETSLVNIADDDIFQQGLDSIAGWVYLNLDNGVADDGTDADLTADDGNIIASQNWVVVSMRAEGRYSVDFDAAALGNGCTPPAETTEWTDGDAEVGPAADDTDCIFNCPV